MNKCFKYELTMMQASRLVSSQLYQRPISAAEVKNITNEFNEYLVNPIRVSYRGDKYYVWDGQHTLVSIIGLYGENVTVPVLLYKGLTYEEEASLIATLDKNNRKLGKNDKNNAFVESKDETRLAFIAACKKNGFSCVFSNNYAHRIGYVQNPSWVFENVYIRHGDEMLAAFLKVFKEAFHSSADAQRTAIQNGLLKFMLLYKDEYDMNRLISVLKDVQPDILRKNAANDRMHTRTDSICSMIIQMYNKNKRSKLPNKIEGE